MIFRSYEELVLVMGIPIEDVLPIKSNIEAILKAWNEFSDPRKTYEIVEDGVMEFDNEEEYHSWQAPQ